MSPSYDIPKSISEPMSTITTCARYRHRLPDDSSRSNVVFASPCARSSFFTLAAVRYIGLACRGRLRRACSYESYGHGKRQVNRKLQCRVRVCRSCLLLATSRNLELFGQFSNLWPCSPQQKRGFSLASRLRSSAVLDGFDLSYLSEGFC